MTAMNAPIVSIRNVTKTFGAVTAVKDVSLDIRANEFFALLGPSGCGKTTLLRMIAGFSNPSAGQILIDGQDMVDVPPNKRPVNMVFQSYAVFPHMSVEQNIAYGLQVVRTPTAEISTRVGRALERVGLSDLRNRMPEQLSGGQRQRVALARALVKQPKVLLLDEPLSALDAKLREQMQLELSQLQQDVGVTFLIVTHDQDEALSMADRIAVMQDGNVDQVAEPGTLYESPANRFVADFIGKVNLFDGEVFGTQGGKLTVDTAVLGKVHLNHHGEAQRQVCLAIRPEKIRIAKTKPDVQGQITISGRITDWAYYGDCSHMFVETGNATQGGATRLGVVIQNDTRDAVDALDIGDDVHLFWSPDDMLVLNN
jgi:spermidine/putrescine ABC transporter ATP-binding subunit